MTYAYNLWLFAILLVGIIIVPGMDMLFVLSNTLTGGRRAGFLAAAGITAGGVVHTVIGTLGVALVFSMAPWIFKFMIIAGTLYMVWIGITLIRSSIRVSDVPEAQSHSGAVAFRQGFVTCLLNPKAYLFVVTVYPQFLRPEFGPLVPQALVFGLLTAIAQASIYGGLALAASRSASFLVSNPKITVGVGRACGVLFLALAGWSGWHLFHQGL